MKTLEIFTKENGRETWTLEKTLGSVDNIIWTIKCVVNGKEVRDCTKVVQRLSQEWKDWFGVK